MPRACAEADAALIATLRSKYSHLVAIHGAGEPILEREAGTIYLVHLDSPLICEDTPNVEIVLDRDGLRFKPWREV